MLKYLFLMSTLLLFFLSFSPVMAFEVVDTVITTAIVDREPVDKVDVFPRQNGKLYCFSRIIGAVNPITVYHSWYLEEQLMSRVPLQVNSTNWRTWSAKRFLEDWPGEWRVEIQDEDGKMIKVVNFTLR